MFYYIVPYFFLLILSYLIKDFKFQKSTLFFLLFIFLIPAILLVTLRGNIGTDTMQYLSHFKNLDYGGNVHEYEPGFNFLTFIINKLGLNDHIDVAIISFLTILLLCKSFSISKGNVIIFSGLIFPIFFYDMTVNGLRYGLSFALSSIAIDLLYKKKFFIFILIAMFSISIQYSSFLIIFIFLVFKLEKKYLIILSVVLLLIFIFGASFFADNILYLYDKQDAYKDLVSPSITSGLGPLMLFLIVFFYFIYLSTKERSNNILFLILILEFSSFALAKVSYAGLRFQMLFLFVLILLIKQEYYLIVKKVFFLRIVLFVGFLGFMLTIKNINAVVEDSESTYIPYKFFWEEKE